MNENKFQILLFLLFSLIAFAFDETSLASLLRMSSVILLMVSFASIVSQCSYSLVSHLINRELFRLIHYAECSCLLESSDHRPHLELVSPSTCGARCPFIWFY
jgi:hypothetical protein